MIVAILLAAKRNLLVHLLGSEVVEVCEDHHLIGRVDGIILHPRKKSVQSKGINRLKFPSSTFTCGSKSTMNSVASLHFINLRQTIVAVLFVAVWLRKRRLLMHTLDFEGVEVRYRAFLDLRCRSAKIIT